jgi:SAM-dependent methyltransferase
MQPSDESIRVNQHFYDRLWATAKLRPPPNFNTWPLLSRLAADAPVRLEIGAGMRPRVPIAGTHFAELSRPAADALAARAGIATRADIAALPYRDTTFDLVCAFDIIEHVAEDRRALAEIARVLRPGGALVLSVPLYMHAWTFFDELVGHCRRYEPADLERLLASHGFVLAESAAYGMQPRSTALLRFGMWWLEQFPIHAMNAYNRVVMPLALAFQKRLDFAPGLVRDARVDEVVLVCRRSAAPA